MDLIASDRAGRLTLVGDRSFVRSLRAEMLRAIFPVVPFFALTGATPSVASFVLSALALCVIGAATSLFTGRSLLISASRQLVIGLAAALVTFGIGRAVGGIAS